MNSIRSRITADTEKIARLRSARNEARGELAALAEMLAGLSAVWALLPAIIRERLTPYLPGQGT